jgi:hypothetical protein
LNEKGNGNENEKEKESEKENESENTNEHKYVCIKANREEKEDEKEENGKEERWNKDSPDKWSNFGQGSGEQFSWQPCWYRTHAQHHPRLEEKTA